MSSDHNHADAPSFPLTHLTAQDVQIQGRHFVDPHGRVLNLRGANVSGSSKVPSRPIPKIHEHAQVNYINRPFPLEEADLHWRRLKSWGMTFLRITVTWEAVEHEGQGVYDEGYLEYLRKFLESMEKYGLVAYIAIHQDVWSRYSGGSGAPGWTMASAGFDLSDDGEKLALSGAAFLDGIKGGRLGGERGLWPTGYQKLAAATMNTLFWGGETFAPSLKVPTTTSNGRTTKVNIQTYLQDAFLKMFERLVDAVGDVGSVMGFELMNEPHPGYIGLPSIHEWNYNTDLHLGQFPSPLQSFSMGSGRPTDNVPIYKRSFPWPTTISSYSTGNPEGVSAWTKGQEGCIWEKEGIWRWSDNKNIAVALQEDYFTKDRSGRKVDFYEDFYFPFVQKWNAVLARTQKLKQKGDGDGLMRMVEMIPNEFCPEYDEAKRPDNMVYAPHWYDLNALFKKQFGYMTVNVQGLSRGMFLPKALYFGPNGAKANYAKQIQTIVLEARLKLGALPVIIGECGVPMDLNNEYALKTGDWKAQQQMMDAMISALESANVGFNLWTYNPANRDDIGDDWNAENFSWYSDHNRSIALKKSDNDGEEDLDAGGRLMDVIVRPYAIATAGTPLSSSYDAETALFTHRFTSPIRISTDIPSIEEVTEIFLPKRVYTEGQVRFALSLHGKIYFDWPNQRCWVWFDDPPYHHSIDLGPRGTKENKVRRVDIWVPGRTKPRPWTTLHLLGIVLFFVVAVLGILKAQEIEWDKEDSALRFHRPGSRSWFKT